MKTQSKIKENVIEQDTDTIAFEKTVAKLKKHYKRVYMTTIADEKIVFTSS